MKTLSILGSTGSTGTQALKVVRGLNRDGRAPMNVGVLAAHHNVELLEAQAREPAFRRGPVCRNARISQRQGRERLFPLQLVFSLRAC